jgi:hypothetical protein
MRTRITPTEKRRLAVARGHRSESDYLRDLIHRDFTSRGV